MTGSDTVEVYIEPDLSGFVAALERAREAMGRLVDAAEFFTVPPVLANRPVDDAHALFDLTSHGCWAHHPRQTETELERAIRQYNVEHPTVRVGLNWGALFERAIRAGLFNPGEQDETTGPDTYDCSANGGGKWSDFMARLDDAIGEAA